LVNITGSGRKAQASVAERPSALPPDNGRERAMVRPHVQSDLVDQLSMVETRIIQCEMRSTRRPQRQHIENQEGLATRFSIREF